MTDSPTKKPPSNKKTETYLEGGLFNKFFFFWVNKLMKKNDERCFQQEDNWALRKGQTSYDITSKFSSTFQKLKPKRFVLFRTLIDVNKGLFAKSLSYSLFARVLGYSSPFLINQTLAYIAEPEKELATGIMLCLGIILSRVLLSIFDSQADMCYTILDTNIVNGANGLIYEKALKYSLLRSQDHSFGSLINNIQVDSSKLCNIGWVLEGVFVFPATMLIGFYLMYTSVGLSFLAGIGVIAVMGGVNYVIGNKYMEAEQTQMEKKDEKMKISSEILNAIKYIKMLGQEKFFLNKVIDARESELTWLRKMFMCTMYSIFFIYITPVFMTTVIFATYIFTGHEMTAQSAFTTLSTLYVLEYPIRSLPERISYALEFKVSLERIKKFLMAEEIETDCIKRFNDKNCRHAIKVTNGNFFWNSIDDQKQSTQKEEADNNKKEDTTTPSKFVTRLELTSVAERDEQPLLNSFQEKVPETSASVSILKDINLEIKKGTFVAILGDVGSGKSSLLYSLVGEMTYNKNNPPQIELNGSLTYVGQQPWILNTTVKNNILFGEELDSRKYNDVIKYSCLESDLDILIHKDETEIGEKGVNLSGGQKARVSLARALYRQSDIYLLDDPLSAVDAHVGNFILKECFMGYLKDKTRVLVTHKFEALKYVDHIYIFKDGKIVEEGTLESLKNSPVFQEFERKCKVEEMEGDVYDDDKETKQDHETPKAQSDNKLVEKSFSTAETEALDLENDDKVSGIGVTEEEKKDINERLMLDEDREIGSISWKVWKCYFSYYGGVSYYCLLFTFMLVWITLLTGSNLWVSYWCDNAERLGYSNALFLELYWVFGFGAAIGSLFIVALLYQKSLNCSRTLHRDMFSKIIRAPLNLFFDRVPIGRILNRLNSDLSVLDSSIAYSFDYFIDYSLSLASDIIVCMIVGSYWILLLALAFLVIACRLQVKKMNLKREVTRLENITKSPIVSHFSESLNGLTSIRVYEDQKRFFDKFHYLRDENLKNIILSIGINCWFNIRISLCSSFMIIPFVAVPILLYNENTLTPGLVGVILTYALSINEDIGTLLWGYADFETNLVSLERCHAFTKIQGEAENSSIAARSNWPEKGTIEFRNYAVRYRPNLPLVIKNLNVTITGGEKIGVVGKTGSGKSTLFLTLLRILEPSQGKILIDNVDISQLSLDDLRSKITIISQDPMLFEGTLRQNLDILGTYTDQELLTSLEKICMKEKFEQDKGLDTEIKEGGGNLSAGEKQLICIGRAILAKTKVILIDEATSNIDPKTEQVILSTIQNSFLDCTVITIAHRLKTVINSDKILVMKDGELMEYDTPYRLINDEDTLFHNLWMEYEHAQHNT